MKKYDFQPSAVKSLEIGAIIRGNGLTGKTSGSKCQCCGKALGKHDWVRVVPCRERPNTGYKTLLGVGCERPDVDAVVKAGAKLELKVGFKADADVALGGLTTTLTKAPFTFSPVRDPETGKFTGNGILTVYCQNCKAIGKLGKMLSELGIESRKQRMTNANGESTDWEDVDSTTWAPYMGCGFYHGNKVYGV